MDLNENGGRDEHSNSFSDDDSDEDLLLIRKKKNKSYASNKTKRRIMIDDDDTGSGSPSLESDENCEQEHQEDENTLISQAQTSRNENNSISLAQTPLSVKEIRINSEPTGSTTTNDLILSFGKFKLSPMTCSKSDLSDECSDKEETKSSIDDDSEMFRAQSIESIKDLNEGKNDNKSVVSINSNSTSTSVIFSENRGPITNKNFPIDCDVSVRKTYSKTQSEVQFTGNEEKKCLWGYNEKQREYYLSEEDKSSSMPNLSLPKKLYNQLFKHQKEGVQWMASMHKAGIGGILGDDMGMGKTFQTLTYLGGLMRQLTIKNALIVAPVSLLRTWQREAQNVLKKYGCAPTVTITVLGSDVNKSRRRHLLMAALGCKAKYPHLVITTYGLVASSPADLLPPDYKGRPTKWDYVVLDEGHKIKNPSTNVSKGCRIICEGRRKGSNKQPTRRLLLTGTPIQNNLKELWALFDWSTSGKLLGKQQTFRNRFASPIEDGRHKDALPSTIRIANKANKELQKTIQPHFLQRLKKTTFNDKLPKKRELVIWTHLSAKQRSMYENYLAFGETVQRVLSGEVNSPLEAITYLKKVCGHPSLVRSHSKDKDNIASSVEQLIEDSAKLESLLLLCRHLHKSGHRMLIFSQSTKMLDILEKVLQPLKMGRIDGKTKERDRQYMVDKFNKNKSKLSIMLLSTKAAGLGLTLTGADRAIIYDPSWNPADDSQAVDRCYRIGQTKDVTVYRLIAAGTVEERMYEKQVFKDGIRRAILTNGGDATERHFDKADLKKMFTLTPAGQCDMIEKLSIETISDNSSILKSHHCVIGITSHDLVYTQEEVIVDANEIETPFATTPFHSVSKTDENDENFIRKRLDGKSTTGGRDKENLFSNRILHFHEFSPLKKDQSRQQLSKQPDATRAQSYRNDYKTDLKPLPIEQCLNKVNECLKRDENLEACMQILLDMIEADDVDKLTKLRVHKNIAKTANRLRWLT